MSNYKGNQYILQAAKEVKRMKDKRAANFMKSFYGATYTDGYADAAEELVQAIDAAIIETPGIGGKLSTRLKENIQAALNHNKIIVVDIDGIEE